MQEKSFFKIYDLIMVRMNTISPRLDLYFRLGAAHHLIFLCFHPAFNRSFRIVQQFLKCILFQSYFADTSLFRLQNRAIIKMYLSFNADCEGQSWMDG